MRPSPPIDEAEQVVPEPLLQTVAPADTPAPQAGTTALCPVDRLPRRRRNQICLAVIALGLANYMFYTLTYAALGGDAHNGQRRVEVQPDGTKVLMYYVRGHFIHSLAGRERPVSQATWIYSYLHSISLPITSGAMIVAMLVLARPHILATMRGGLVSGQTVVTVFATIVVLITLATSLLFAWSFAAEMSHA